MIILLTGASHTGKTILAQHFLEKYQFPYLSIDHLKMGLIRSGQTTLTPEDDDELAAYLWPIVREIAKTAIENGQNLIIEGDYIPFDWKQDFEPAYLAQIRYGCLVMSEAYIRDHFREIKAHASAIEMRQDDSWCTEDFLLAENAHHLAMCRQYGCPYLLIDDSYPAEIGLPPAAGQTESGSPWRSGSFS